ncbi:MAG: hypothetical protein AB8H80_01005 [Planctomycetota bacterium]
MFVDAVVANVVLFLVGQVFAWLYLRSGRFAVGAAAMISLWVCIDWWLVQRYLLGGEPSKQVLPLLLLQLTVVLVAGAYLWACVRRRRGAAERTERYRAVTRHMLAGELKQAAVDYRALCWTDPWDASAWLGLGDALRRSDDLQGSARAYARAAGVDVDKQFADLLAHRRSLWAAAAASKSAADADSKPSRSHVETRAVAAQTAGGRANKQSRAERVASDKEGEAVGGEAIAGGDEAVRSGKAAKLSSPRRKNKRASAG